MKLYGNDTIETYMVWPNQHLTLDCVLGKIQGQITCGFWVDRQILWCPN